MEMLTQPGAKLHPTIDCFTRWVLLPLVFMRCGRVLLMFERN
jgi:hypothetical protein